MTWIDYALGWLALSAVVAFVLARVFAKMSKDE